MKYIFIICLITFLKANISNDSLAVLIKDGHIKILQNVEYIDPLIDKNFGIEINPLYTLAYSEEKFSFSGTVSLFPKNRKVEIAFPFSKKSRSNYNFDYDDETKVNIDAQYRYFLGKYRKGFYLMTGVRYNHENIKELDDNLLLKDDKIDRGGISFGIGYRIFGQSGFYWGCSFYFGRYFLPNMEEGLNYSNLELFKFGKTF